MKAQRVRHTFTRADILARALEMRADYERQGLTLTLRQMYYQFVARGLLENGQQVYKRIGDVLTEARYHGEFPIDGILDRGRSVRPGDFTDHRVSVDAAYKDAVQAVKNIPYWYLTSDRWFGQRSFVSVWVEKDALAGIFEQTCNRLGVSWFAGKGYPSVSALWEFIKIARRACEVGGCEQVSVLYFGDHDPDGWEIPRSSLRGIEQLLSTYDVELDVQFTRVALNMDQIVQYDPPPFPAKETSARFKGYVEEHGTEDAWELDALEPTVLRDLITENVEAHFNAAIRARNEQDVRFARTSLRARMLTDQFQIDSELKTNNK